MNPRNCLRSLLGLLALYLAMPLSQAQDNPTGLTQLKACEQSCSTSLGLCHWRLAEYLLRGPESGLPQCLRENQGLLLSNLPTAARLQLGIEQLELAITNPTGVTPDRTELHMEEGAAYVNLAYLHIESDNFQTAAGALRSAAQEYQSALSDWEGPAPAELLSRVAAGLIRASAPVDALSVLHRLPLANPSRSYLTAEALFNLQDRDEAAKYYEIWIASGCDSEIFMMTYNEYGKRWTLLPLKRPIAQTKCEQLPGELRLRLETLWEQFQHPNNIPPHSYPTIPFPDHADSTARDTSGSGQGGHR